MRTYQELFAPAPKFLRFFLNFCPPKKMRFRQLVPNCDFHNLLEISFTPPNGWLFCTSLGFFAHEKSVSVESSLSDDGRIAPSTMNLSLNIEDLLDMASKQYVARI